MDINPQTTLHCHACDKNEIGSELELQENAKCKACGSEAVEILIQEQN